MRSRIIFLAATVMALALAVLCGYIFCVRSVFARSGSMIAVAAYIIFLAASIPVCDLLHEGGHLLVGACCKMGVKLNKYRPFAPSSVDVSPTGERSMRGRMIAVALAGLALNAACCVLGAVAACFSGVFCVFCVILPYSLYLLVINGVPDDRNGAVNDGMLAHGLISRSDAALVMLAILRVQGMVNGGMKLKDVPEECLLNVPQLPEDDINFIILTKLRYEYYLARGDMQSAEKYLSRYQSIKQYLPAEYRQ